MRAAVLAVLDRIKIPPRAGMLKETATAVDGWNRALRVAREAVCAVSLSRDEWRVVPGAENPRGLPVEAPPNPTPREGVRAWLEGGEEGGTRYGSERHVPGGFDVVSLFPVGFIAWRPAAAGPGEAP